MKIKIKKVKQLNKFMFVRAESQDHEVLYADYKTGISDLINSLGITSREFAKRIGCSVRTVEGWKYGKSISDISMSLIKKTFKL